MGLLFLALLLSAKPAVAECHQTVTAQGNTDGSQLRITQSQCDGSGSRRIRVELRPQPSAPYTTVLQRTQSVAAMPRGDVSLRDIDGDGLLEVMERETCGAGPNCTYRIFKVNPSQRRADLFFTGGFFAFRRISGFYVSSGRSSCCSWVHQLYRPPAREGPIQETDLVYRLTVKAPPRGATAAQCLISRPVGRAWVPIDLKDPQLLKLCAVYGDAYVVNPPGDTRAGAAPMP